MLLYVFNHLFTTFLNLTTYNSLSKYSNSLSKPALNFPKTLNYALPIPQHLYLVSKELMFLPSHPQYLPISLTHNFIFVPCLMNYCSHVLYFHLSYICKKHLQCSRRANKISSIWSRHNYHAPKFFVQCPFSLQHQNVVQYYPASP